MSMARTARRRRKQFVMGFKHITRLGRPIYRRPGGLGLHEAIARERQKASAEAARRKDTKKKKK